MHLLIRLVAIVWLLFPGSAHAQFPLVASSEASLVPLHSLSGGARVMPRFTPTTTQQYIYNLDNSVHRVLTVPPAPAGMEWTKMLYISESLFDTDPTTIEYALIGSQQGWMGFGFFVYRENGTLVFQQNPGNMLGVTGGGPSLMAPIFEVNDQTYLLLYDGLPGESPTKIYELPGQLPCIDCTGQVVNGELVTGQGTEVEGTTGIRVFPNPTQQQLIIDLGPEHQGTITVRLFDADGRLALQRDLLAAERVELQTGSLARGAYLCQISVDGQLLNVLPVVLEQ